MDPLFPALPEDITTLTDEQLAALITERQEIVNKIKARDSDLLEGRDTATVLAELKAGVAAINTVKEEQATRIAVEAELDAAIDELTAGDEDGGEGDPEATGEEEEVEETEQVPEPIAAAVTGRPIRTRRVEPEPVKPDVPVRGFVASSNIQGYREGQVLTKPREVAEAMLAKARSLVASPEGFEEKIVVGRLYTEFPEERTLVMGDEEGNTEKVAAVVGRNAMGVGMDGTGEVLLASGGLCAPVTPYYDLELIATARRPVRDSLPVFNATRGGIRFGTPPGLAAVTTAIGRVTAAQDQTGGTTGAKSCQQIACPSFTEVDVAMIYQCLRFGNLGSRAWPEQVVQFTNLVAAAAARLAETALLDGISAASTATTGAQIAGANSTLLGQILTAAAGQRSRNRMEDEAVLRVLLPAWVKELLVTDLIRSQFQRFDMTIDGVEALLRSFHVAPTFYIDGPTTGSQVFGAQGAGVLLPFPPTVKWWIFPEGSFLYLDAGTLDVGIVRDSTLNLSNDFQVFSEVFENIAFVGVESLQVISTVCANGQVTLPITASGCTA